MNFAPVRASFTRAEEVNAELVQFLGLGHDNIVDDATGTKRIDHLARDSGEPAGLGKDGGTDMRRLGGTAIVLIAFIAGGSVHAGDRTAQLRLLNQSVEPGECRHPAGPEPLPWPR